MNPSQALTLAKKHFPKVKFHFSPVNPDMLMITLGSYCESLITPARILRNSTDEKFLSRVKQRVEWMERDLHATAEGCGNPSCAGLLAKEQSMEAIHG